MLKKMLIMATVLATSTSFAQNFNESMLGDVEVVSSENKSVPPGLEGKTRMSEEDLAKKKEGSFPGGLPLISYDSDMGFGYGVRAYWTVNGEKSNPFFAYSPYLHQIYIQYFATTNGIQYHVADWDAPYFQGTLYRLRASVAYDRNKSANYFGVGADTMKNLVSPTDSKTYEKISDYNESLREVNGGNANSYYNEYDYEKPLGKFSVEREFLGGLLRPQLGVMFTHTTIHDYSGETIPSAENSATGKEEAKSASTLLNLTKPLGYHGGFVNTAKAGIAFDTRDFEPDPNNGVFVDAVAEVSGRSLGSDYDFQRYTVSPRFYFSPMASLVDLVFAGRFVYSTIDGKAPFFAYNEIGFTDGNKYGLGGYRTLRGYAQDRFVGRTKSMLNFEARWTMFTLTPGSQSFAFILVPFVDFGRVFDAPSDFNPKGWKQGQGAGLRIAWNQSVIIMADYGVSEEGSGLYINFNHIF